MINETISTLNESIPYNNIYPETNLLFILLGFGIFISLFSGLVFAYIMRQKLKDWETNKISPLPLATPTALSSWISFFIGLTFVFTSALQIFNFSLIGSLIFSILNSLLFGITMWRAVKDLMRQLESGEIKEIDDFL